MVERKKSSIKDDLSIEFVLYLKEQVKILNGRVDSLMTENQRLTDTLSTLTKAACLPLPEEKTDQELENKIPKYERHLNEIMFGEFTPEEETNGGLTFSDIGGNEQATVAESTRLPN